MDGQKFLKVILIIIAIIAGKLFSQHFITSTHYKTFKSEGGGFSIIIPTQNKSDIKTLNTPVGEVQIHMQLAHDRNLGIEFGASYFKIPEVLKSMMQNDGKNVFFENMINGMLKDCGGKLLSDKKVEFRNYRGKEYVIKTSDDKIIKVRAFIIKDTVYQLIVNCFPEDRDHRKIVNFFDSFDLIRT